MEIEKAKIYHDYVEGIFHGDTVVTSKKTYKEVKSLYKKQDYQISDDTIMYEVYSYSEGDAQQIGNLNWGLTIMKPVYVNEECNMTRGHFHVNLDCAEFYFCLGGSGILLLMDEFGKCTAEEMKFGSVHHINGRLAHRLVNTGDCDLKVGACWPSNAGHDYKRIEELPFTVRIFKRDNQIVMEEK